MRRVLIARAMLFDPEIIILDEITANLEQQSSLNILMVIADLAVAGKSMILVGHHHDEIAGFYNRVVEIDKCEIISISKIS